MDINAPIYISGHNGLVGSAILRKLKKLGFNNLFYKDKKDLDLRDKVAVNEFFANTMPQYVFNAAALVGGIKANNDYPADFIYDNLSIQTNIISSCCGFGVSKLLFLSSACVYPKNCEQPIVERSVLSSPMEESNLPYAIAKIAGSIMCDAYRRQYGCNFITAVPCNVYGINDNYHVYNSHVIAGLLGRFYDAACRGDKIIKVWGTGKVEREFINSDDLADACVFLMDNYDDPSPINVGTGSSITIKSLAELIAKITGYNGEIIYDASQLEGVQKRTMDSSKINKLGWKSSISLEDGIKEMFGYYKAEVSASLP